MFVLLFSYLSHLHGLKDNGSSTASTATGPIKHRIRVSIGADGSVLHKKRNTITVNRRTPVVNS